MRKAYYVYMLTNKPRGVLYTGVTNDVRRRFGEHGAGAGSEFAKKYGLDKLVYVEEHARVSDAINPEKRLKRWRRDWKIELIENANPDWLDLSEGLGF